MLAFLDVFCEIGMKSRGCLWSVDLVHKRSQASRWNKFVDHACFASPHRGRHLRFQLLCFVLIRPKGNTLCGCWGQWIYVNVTICECVWTPVTSPFFVFSTNSQTVSVLEVCRVQYTFRWIGWKLPGTASSELCWKTQSLFLQIFLTSARVPSWGDRQRGRIEIAHKTGRTSHKEISFGLLATHFEFPSLNASEKKCWRQQSWNLANRESGRTLLCLPSKPLETRWARAECQWCSTTPKSFATKGPP